MTRAGASASWAARLVTENLGTKLLSLSLSVVLFSLVHSEEDAQRSVFVDVVATLPPDDAKQVLLTELPHELKVTLRGSRSRLQALDHNDFQPIQIDLTDPGRKTYNIERSSVTIAGNVQVIDISPAVLSLKWAERAERVVSIVPQFEGELGPGLSVDSELLLRPRETRVSGPVTAVESLQEVKTEGISISDYGVGDYEVQVPLVLPPQHIRFADELIVLVAFRIREETVRRTFRRLSVAAIGVGGAKLRPSAVSVVVEGPARRVSELVADGLVPFVEAPPDSDGLTRPYQVLLRGDLQGVDIVSISPPSVLLSREKSVSQKSRASRESLD